jgi:hypothetical protein
VRPDRPKNPLSPAPETGPHAVGEVRCVHCGWEGVACVPVGSPCYNPETGALDMLQCPVPDCRLYTVCSV